MAFKSILILQRHHFDLLVILYRWYLSSFSASTVLRTIQVPGWGLLPFARQLNGWVVRYGQRVSSVKRPWPLADIVLRHHERLDGSGYPQGLKNDGITLEAKIISVADVIEAMTSHSPYCPALGLEQALDEIAKHRGTLYDHDVVDICVKLFEEKRLHF